MENISFSQVSRYMQCPRSYKYYYVDKLRERTATAFLAFGSAMDVSLNAVLNDLKTNGSVTADYKDLFDRNWKQIEINKRIHSLPCCTLVGYSKADFIPQLLTDQDIVDISNLCTKLNISGSSVIDTLFEELNEKKSQRAHIVFTDEEHQILNFMNWCSMRRKAHLMLDAYVRVIIPKIEQVIEVQKKIEMHSPCGTKFIGYVDAVVKLKGYTEPTVLDNKTSSTFYDADKVGYSQQLAAYGYKLGLKNAAFAVMLKNIKLNKTKTCATCGNDGTGKRHRTCDKIVSELGERDERCGGDWIEKTKPEADIQFITGVIPQQVQDMVMDNNAEVLEAIKAGVFPRNLNTCQNLYGNPCPYIRKCWSDKEDGLEVVK